MINKLSWLGTLSSIIGSFCVAFGYNIGFVFFTLGSITWLTVGVYRKDKSLITLNLFFMAANIIGLHRVIINL